MVSRSACCPTFFLSFYTYLLLDFVGFLHKVFLGASHFDVAVVNLWDVTLVGDMANIFRVSSNSDAQLNYEPLCGLRWMENPASHVHVRLAKASCYCAPGHFFLSSETSCSPCPDGEHSLGGYEETCDRCVDLDPEHYCSDGEKLRCPTNSGLSCYHGVRCTWLATPPDAAHFAIAHSFLSASDITPGSKGDCVHNGSVRGLCCG